MKFLCDRMLGSLSIWLRLLGYDTLYPRSLGDREIAAKVYDEGRVLLTRDGNLASRVQGAFYIASDNLDEQLKAVVEKFRLNVSDPLSLCSVCNVSIVDISKDDIRGKVPPAVFKNHDKFWICPSCNRIYWKGTHWNDIIHRIENL